ncbi:hypothetical protein AHAS_Ahas17G0160500 [Arachis hypogaea]
MLFYFGWRPRNPSTKNYQRPGPVFTEKKKTHLKHPYFCLLGELEPIPLSQATTHKRPPLPIPTQSPLLSPSHLLPHSPVTAEHNGSQRRSFPSPACRHRWLLCLIPAPSVSAESARLCFLAFLSSVSASLGVAVVDGASALLAPSLLAGGLPLQPQPVAVFLLLLLQCGLLGVGWTYSNFCSLLPQTVIDAEWLLLGLELHPGLKNGPNGTTFISSGISDLDKILGGGFSLGSLVMIMEDAEAPHHMLLLRNFMSQGLLHRQPLLYASPSKDPRAFLGTLPSPGSSKDDTSHKPSHEKDLRIAWQYKKYFGEPQLNINTNNGGHHDYCNDLDLRKPLERHFFTSNNVDCVSIQNSPNLDALKDRCAEFLAQFSRNEGSISSAGRIAIQSFCSPQCKYSDMEWHMLSFIRSLKGMARSSNVVVVVTFPPSLLSPSCSKRLQHMADTLLSVRAIPDEDKELAKLLTGYQDMVGLLNVHKVARLNTQPQLTVQEEVLMAILVLD